MDEGKERGKGSIDNALIRRGEWVRPTEDLERGGKGVPELESSIMGVVHWGENPNCRSFQLR